MTFELIRVTKLTNDPNDHQYVMDIRVTTLSGTYTVTFIGTMQVLGG